MLSDDDHDSLFGDDSQSDYERAGLALPSHHGKAMAATTCNDECGGSRVGTSALSVSPIPVSERSSPAALVPFDSSATPAQSVVSSANVPPNQPLPTHSQSRQVQNTRVATTVPELPANGPRPKNFLRSQSNLLGVAGIVSSNLPGPKVTPPPTGASADDAIPILDDDEEPQRPKKRRRKVAPQNSDTTSSPADAIRVVTRSLTTDLTVTSLFQALLEHLKSFSHPNTSKTRRVDVNGREISEEEWRFLKTQDLVRKLSAAIKKALKAAGGSGSNTTGTGEMLQTVIQQWIQSKLVSQAVSTPSVTPAPSTPLSLASLAPLSTTSTQSMLPSISPDSSAGIDLTWKNNGLASWGTRETIPADSGTGLGILISPDQSLGGGSGQFDFREIESLLGLIPAPESSPSISLQPETASPTLEPAIDPSLPHWMDLPLLSASQPWTSEAPSTSTSHLSNSTALPPVNVPILQQRDQPDHGGHVSTPDPSVPNPALPNTGEKRAANPGKTSKMAATLKRARSHRQSLQAAMDKALTTMWELEIEHATLSKVLKGITDRQASSSTTH